jgi:hypothetical protein
MKHKIALSICLCLLCLLCNAQKINLSGYIEDYASSEKLIGASAVDLKTNKGTVANVYGFYSLYINAEGGEAEVKFSYLGYQPIIIKFKPKHDTIINCKLISNTTLKEVVISAERQERIENKTDMSRINIPIEQIKNMPALFGEVDVLKALQLLPGVQKGSEGTAGIYVRGGGPDQNLILLDGVPIYNPNHLFGFFSVFNADAISNVELIKGGFPARYGGRLSSVIDITMKDGDNQKIHGSAGVGIIASRFTVEGPIIKNKASFIFSARRTYIDFLARPIIKAQANGATAGIFFYDLNGKVNWRLNDKNRIFLSSYLGDDVFYGGFDDSYTLGPKKYTQTSDFGLKWGNKMAAARWNRIVASKLFMNTTLTYTKYRYQISNDFQDKVDSLGTTLSNDKYYQRVFSGIEDFAGRINFDYKPNNNHYIRFGTSYIYHIFNPGSVQTKITSTTVPSSNLVEGASKLYSNEASLYAEDDIKLFDKLTMNLGLHQAYFRIASKNYFSLQPRIATNYRLPLGIALKASYAEMTQYLHLLSNQGIGLPTDLWVPVTDKILPQKAKQMALGFARTFFDEYEVSAEGYYKKMLNVIEYKEGAGNFISSNDWQNQVTSGQGYSYGGEFFIQRKVGKTTGWIGYTISKTMRQFDAKNQGRWYPYKYDRRHDIGITINHKFNDKFDFSASWVYGTGNAISIPISSYNSVADFYNYSGFGPGGFNKDYQQTVKEYDQLNNVRMRSYHRMDIGFNFHRKKKYIEATWNLSFYNAYNRKNPFFYYQGYNDQGNERIFQVSLFPILPSLSYNIKF